MSSRALCLFGIVMAIGYAGCAGGGVRPSAQANIFTAANNPSSSSSRGFRNPFKELAQKKKEPAPSGSPAGASAAREKPPTQAKSASGQTIARTRSTGELDAETPAAKSASTRTATAPSAELKGLIDRELADATQEERREWMEQIKLLDPAMVPEILKARRLTRSVIEQSTRSSMANSRYPENENRQSERSGSYAVPDETNFRRTPSYRESEDDFSTKLGRRDRPAERLLVGKTDDREVSRRENDFSDPRSRSSVTDEETIAFRSKVPPRMRDVAAPQNSIAASEIAYPQVSYHPMTPIQPVSRSSDGSIRKGADLDHLIAQAERDLVPLEGPTNRQEYLRRHVWLRMLYFLANRQERALTAIPGVEPAEQEFWQQMIWSMTNYFDAEHFPEEDVRATQTLAQLQTAVRRLQERANLTLRNASFCQEIAYFGTFERFPRDEFSHGTEVLLYVEVENFRADLTSEGQFRTLLRSSIEILSPSGEVREKFPLPATEDLCRNARRDYFHSYKFFIPDKLPRGPHLLKLTITDELSGKLASTTVPFTVK